jgi:hypothetical protein
VQRVYGGAGANPEWFETVTVRSMSDSVESIESKCAEMYVNKEPDNGVEFAESEYAEIAMMTRAWCRAALVVRENCLTPFVHDSNTPAKSNDELKTIVVIPFERLINKYWDANQFDLDRFTIGYDHDEARLIASMLAQPF